MHSDHTWKRTGWWRIERSDGTLFMETSSETEVREAMIGNPSFVLLVHLRCSEEKWAVTT